MEPGQPSGSNPGVPSYADAFLAMRYLALEAEQHRLSGLTGRGNRVLTPVHSTSSTPIVQEHSRPRMDEGGDAEPQEQQADGDSRRAHDIQTMMRLFPMPLTKKQRTQLLLSAMQIPAEQHQALLNAPTFSRRSTCR